MLDSTLRHGSRAESWKAMPSWCPRRSSCGLRPSTLIEPLVGSSSPARIRRIVDLPQPDGPSSDRKVPRAVCRSASCSAVTDRPRMRKILVSPETCTPVPRATPRAPAVLVSSATGSAGVVHEVGVLLVDLVEQGQVEQVLGGDVDA